MKNTVKLARTLVSLFSLWCCSPSLAQHSTSGPCDVPVTVSGWNKSVKAVELVKNLETANFEVQVGGHPVSLRSAAVDAGPKRVVLVLDATTKIADSEWQLTADMAMSIIRNARKDDRFAFVTGDFAEPDRRFLRSAEASDLLRKLRSTRPAS